MPRLKLTEKGISRLAAPDVSGRQTIYWDTQMHGFGVLVSGKSDAKTFVAQRRLPDGTHRRVTIGSASLLSLDKAKDDAKGRLVDLLRGIDQRAEQRKRRRAEATMQQVLEAYLDARKDLRAKSRKDYRLTVERYLTPWLDIPIRSISGEMVEVRHREIKSEIERRQRYNGEAAANGAMRVFRLLWNFAGERDPDSQLTRFDCLSANGIPQCGEIASSAAISCRHFTGRWISCRIEPVVITCCSCCSPGSGVVRRRVSNGPTLISNSVWSDCRASARRTAVSSIFR
jgi:hypothetical protein